MMMAPAPVMMVQTSAAPQKAAWKEPTFMEVKNGIPCCVRFNGPCSEKYRTFETFQDTKCQMPACQYEACTRCESEDRFCPQYFGPRYNTGCGRLICAHHAKWYHGHGFATREIIICSEGCDKERLDKMCKMNLFTFCCGGCACPIVTCCRGKIEVGQKYRGPQGEEKFHGRGDPMF